MEIQSMEGNSLGLLPLKKLRGDFYLQISLTLVVFLISSVSSSAVGGTGREEQVCLGQPA